MSDDRVRAADLSLWEVRVTQTIGQQVRLWRKRRGLTMAGLAERTEVNGYRVPPSVLTNLELGRRDHISIAELLIIAAALDVSPTMLFAPVTGAADHEVLPNVWSSPWATRNWMLSRAHPDYKTFDDAQWRTAATPVVAYDTHEALARDYVSTLRQLDEVPPAYAEPLGDDRETFGVLSESRRRTLTNHLLATLGQLRRHRAKMRELGYVLPDLPVELAGYLLDEEEA